MLLHLWKYLQEVERSIRVVFGLSVFFGLATAGSEIVFAHAATKFALGFLKDGYASVSLMTFGIDLEVDTGSYFVYALLLRIVIFYWASVSAAMIYPLSEYHGRRIMLKAGLSRNASEFWGGRDKQYYFGEVVAKASNTLLMFSQLICLLIITSILGIVILVRFPKIAVLAVLVGFATALILRMLKRRTGNILERHLFYSNRVIQKYQELLRNRFYLKIMGVEAQAIGEIEAGAKDVKNLHNKFIWVEVLFPAIPMAFLALAMWGLATRGFDPSILAAGDGALAAFYLLLRVAQNGNGLAGVYAALHKDHRYAVALSEASQYLLPSKDTNSQDSAEHFALAKAPDLLFNRVGFGYPNSERLIIDSIDVHVFPGQCLVVTGESGSGKSTLLSLLLGEHSPTTGTISIAGCSPPEFFDRCRRGIGYVGPMPFVVAGTLRENLTLGLSKACGDEEILAMLDAVGLGDAIGTSPDLDLSFANDEIPLSGGQLQRLCIARALLGSPYLLVLDEFTANLDAETERRIFELIASLKGKTTVVLASHSRYASGLADQKIDLDTSPPVSRRQIAVG